MTKKKVDLFQADKAMSERVVDFMTKKVWSITLKVRCQAELEQLQKGVDYHEYMIEHGTEEERAESAMKLEKINTDMQSVQEKYKKQIEEESAFEWINQDNTFWKSYQKSETDEDIKKAICQWFAPYKLYDISGTTLEENIFKAISGERLTTAKKLVNSGAKIWTSRRTKTDVMKTFYAKLAEMMIDAGTIKATNIPEDVQKYYAPKEKKNKKGQK